MEVQPEPRQMLMPPLHAGLYLQCLHQVQVFHAHQACQLSPHKHSNIVFGQTTQLTHIHPYSPHLSTEGIKRIQDIIGTLLYYAHAVDIKLLATLSTLSSQQATTTKATNVAMNQLLD
jgi:hypothetical protein